MTETKAFEILSSAAAITENDVTPLTFSRLNSVKEIAEKNEEGIIGIWFLPITASETTLLIHTTFSLDANLRFQDAIGEIFNYERTENDKYSIFEYREDVIDREAITEDILAKALTIYYNKKAGDSDARI